MLLAHASALFKGQVGDGTLDFVEFAEELQRLLADWASVIAPPLMELAPCMRQTAGLGDAEFEARLVAREVVTHLHARSAVLTWAPEERAGMLPATAFGEVEHYGAQRIVSGRAVAREVRPMRLAIARLEHRHLHLLGLGWHANRCSVPCELVGQVISTRLSLGGVADERLGRQPGLRVKQRHAFAHREVGAGADSVRRLAAHGGNTLSIEPLSGDHTYP